MLSYQIWGATDTGRVRKQNEDHILVGRFVKNRGVLGLSLGSDDDFVKAYGLLLCVADGIGGEAGGEMASRLGLLTLEKAFYAASKDGEATTVELLQEAAGKANAVVLDVADNKPQWAGMGATLSGVCLLGDKYWTFNAGDSRVYRYRNGWLKQLTRDDTLADIAIRSGAMSFNEATDSHDSHVLTNCLGKREFTLAVNAGPTLRDGDRLLVCSDGLYDMVDDERLAALLAQMDAALQDGATQIRHLLSQANRAGGRDNISVILIQVRDA